MILLQITKKMGKSDDFFGLSGTFYGITFYKRNGKTFAREKSNLTKERFNSEPEFEGSRCSTKDFGYSQTLGKIIRDTIHLLLNNAAKGHHILLANAIRAALKRDTINSKGSKRLINADLKSLEGFSFNKHSHVKIDKTQIELKDSQIKFKGSFDPKDLFRKPFQQSAITFGIIELMESELSITNYNSISTIINGNNAEVEFSFPIQNISGNIIFNILVIEAMDGLVKSNNRKDNDILIMKCFKI